jgi:hypothetical protein
MRCILFLFCLFVVACDRLPLGVQDERDYPPKWKGRYTCVLESIEVRSRTDTCELSFLSGGSVYIRVSENVMKDLTWNGFGILNAQEGQLSELACQSVSVVTRETNPRTIYQREAGKEAKYLDMKEDWSLRVRDFLENSRALHEALPQELIECSGRPIAFHLEGNFLIVREGGRTFRFQEAGVN